MSLKRMSVALVGAALVIGGCTNKKGQEVQLGDQTGQQASKSGPQDQGTASTGEQAGGNDTIEQTVPVVTLNQNYFASRSLDLNNLNYKFTYLTFNKADTINFKNGAATLAFQGLPAGKSGDMALDIYEGGTLKLRGIAKNVTLQKGQDNKITMTMSDVSNGSSSDTTNLSIDVKLDNSVTTTGGTGGGASDGGSSDGSGGIHGGSSGSDGGGSTGSTQTDPLASWDGKSFKGNDRWDIVPVPY